MRRELVGINDKGHTVEASQDFIFGCVHRAFVQISIGIVFRFLVFKEFRILFKFFRMFQIEKNIMGRSRPRT